MRRFAVLTALITAMVASVLPAGTSGAADPADPPIVITEQGFDRIAILAPTDAAFSTDTTLWTLESQ